MKKFRILLAEDKDDVGGHAHDPDNAVCTTLRLARDAGISMLAITDLCYCEYTSHGHCGPLNHPLDETAPRPRPAGRHGEKRKVQTSPAFKSGQITVDNHATIEQLAKQAVLHAEAGADIIAPSGMMDHAVGAVRQGLDAAGFNDKVILSYAVKYASSFYGPFREATGTSPQFGDRRSYQMDYRRGSREAIREALLDVQEGADIVMVKPGMVYLDILRCVADAVPVPCAAYQVSGEYAMLKAAAAAGAIDEKQCVIEIMHAFRRAGASFILTYYAMQMIEWLSE